jgi:ABC-type branched-subunit amino acid transport system ATPase component
LSVSKEPTAARPAPSLRAEHITSGYGGVPVVRDVSIDVGPGEVVAIIGPNGAGKSTLLKSLVGILRVTEGRILLGQDDVTNHAPEDLARRGVGYVPQVNDIFEPLTVYENLEMGGYLLKSDQIKKRAEEVMAVFPQLPPMLKRRADKLSGGERKMLAIARVLMLRPHVIILDEPTANLSPALARDVLEHQVRALAKAGSAVVLVEQRASEALAVGDWGYLLVAGRLSVSAAASKLLAREDIGELFLGRGAHPPAPRV